MAYWTVSLLSLAIVVGAEDQSASSIQALIDANQGNKTALHSILAPSWVNSPEFRGSSDILRSCLLTLLACVYTALHLNIPLEQGKWKALLTKIRWVFITLLAPELPLHSAATQYFEARTLRRDLRDILKQKVDGFEPTSATDDEVRKYKEMQNWIEQVCCPHIRCLHNHQAHPSVGHVRLEILLLRRHGRHTSRYQ